MPDVVEYPNTKHTINFERQTKRYCLMGLQGNRIKNKGAIKSNELIVITKHVASRAERPSQKQIE